MEKRKLSLFDIILNIIIILLGILIIFWMLQLIFGGSPGLSEFNFGLILLIGSLLVKAHRESGINTNEIKHLSRGVREGFERVKEDMGSLKEDMGLIKKKLKI